MRSSSFLSTPSARRATYVILCAPSAVKFLSTPSARRATTGRLPGQADQTISIHALCEEGDLFGWCDILVMHKFLSTPSARRATRCIAAVDVICQDFYPRPLRGGRPVYGTVVRAGWEFLSTPSARRATTSPSTRSPAAGTFLSTPSARRATNSALSSGTSCWNFYPRPLRGGRPGLQFCLDRHQEISIHALCEEGDDGRLEINAYKISISIHALCEEGDGLQNSTSTTAISFLSTPSARRATPVKPLLCIFPNYFYPRPLRGGRRPASGN